jgi:transposase
MHCSGLQAPVYGPRKPRQRVIDPFVPYLRERVMAYPGLTGRRMWRELCERGYRGGYTAVTDQLRQLRPAPLAPFEVRFETPPGAQAQVDFAQFQVVFTDEPAVTRIVWLFSLVLGFSRLIWGRFVLHQDMQTVLRCHMAAFAAIGTLADEVRILEDGILIASHPVLKGRHQRRVAPGHRKMARIARPDRDKPILILRTGDVVAARPLGFYQAVGRRLAHQGERP